MCPCAQKICKETAGSLLYAKQHRKASILKSRQFTATKDSKLPGSITSLLSTTYINGKKTVLRIVTGYILVLSPKNKTAKTTMIYVLYSNYMKKYTFLCLYVLQNTTIYFPFSLIKDCVCLSPSYHKHFYFKSPENC